MFLESIAVAAMLHLPTTHTPQPNRWHDSGDTRAWSHVPLWIRSLSLCVRRHESMQAGHYRAHNGHSSAAGAYQFLTGTWQGNARGQRLTRPWSHTTANRAPAWVQDAVFVWAIRHGGIHAWHGTSCPGT